MIIRTFLGAALLAAAVEAAAHDFWIEPASFRPAAGEALAIRLMVGEHFHGERVARDNARIERFVVRDGSGERAIDGNTRDEPAGRLAILAPGLSIIGYRTRPRPHGAQAPETFESYLREEGLESIVALRARRGDAQKHGVEMFSRSAKALVLQPGTGGARFEEPLGFRLELVPESDPHDRAHGTVTVRLLFEGKPLAGALVTAMHQRDTSLTTRARSDAEGRVTLPVARNGAWLIKAVHMLEAPEGSGVEWESIWASLTFAR